MKITKRLEMDLSAQGHIPYIDTVQEDACRWVELSLYDGTAPWAIPEGVTAAVAYRKPDGTKGLYDTLPDGSSACLIDGNVVVFALPPQALSIPGHVATTVVFWDADLRPLSTFKMTLRVEESPAVGAVKSEDYFSLSVAIDAAIKAAESPLLVVTVNGDSENGFTVNTAGAELVKAINANKVVLCYWKNKNVYLQMSRYYSDQDITFSSVYKSVEYIINVNSIANIVRYSHINTLGTGSKGVYVGTQEPQNDSVDLWINPDLAEDENQFVPVPKKATVGQVMVVKSVNGEGKPTDWKPVDMSVGSVNPDDIRQAVDDYMEENPVEFPECIPVPSTASVGQTIVVKSVDDAGKPTEWEAADMASGGGGGDTLKFIKTITLTEEVAAVKINTDADGNPLNLKRIVVAVRTIGGTPNTDKSNVFFYPNSVNQGAIRSTLSNGVYATAASVSSVADIQMITKGVYLEKYSCNSTVKEAWGRYGVEETIKEINFLVSNEGYTFGVGTVFHVMGVEA